MARPLRIEYPGAVYHITSRGNARQSIFLQDKDREKFLEILSETKARYNWLCHGFCLMDNHYHVLIETIDSTLSQGMRQLNGVYTQSFNRRQNRVGHVFQGRYKAVLVQKDTHLLELCRYVVLNPVRAKMVEHPGDWIWSSYCATAFGNQPPDWLTTDWILGQFSTKRPVAQERYRRFVEDGLSGGESPWSRLKGQIFFGSPEFVDSMNEITAGNVSIKEIPKVQRHVNRVKLEALFQEINGKQDRNDKIWMAHVQYGYKMKEIADCLSLHYTTVSKIINSKKT
jgi:REP element-mobilizing transposase RayT